MSQPGQHRDETRARELAYWAEHGGVAEYAMHLPSYRQVFPFRALDWRTARILDVGSGPISVFEALAPDGARVVPYDTLAAEYNRLAPDKRYAVVDRIPDEGFTLVTLFNMLDHMDRPEELLSALEPHLAPDGQVWIYVHLDRPFDPAEHPQCFRFWQMADLVERHFRIERCGLTRQGLFVYAWWGVCRPRGAPSRRRRALHTGKVGATYAFFHARRAAIKAVKLAGLRRLLPERLRY